MTAQPWLLTWVTKRIVRNCTLGVRSRRSPAGLSDVKFNGASMPFPSCFYGGTVIEFKQAFQAATSASNVL